MELIDAFPLRQIESVPDPASLYAELMEMILRLAKFGLIHGDFNEFNILVKEVPEGDEINLVPVLIDFPQMMSTTHPNAETYFDRDVNCIKIFFLRKFKFESTEPGPFFKDAIKDTEGYKRLDVEVEATGFNRKLAKDLDRYIETVGRGDGEADPHEHDEEHSSQVEEGTETVDEIEGEAGSDHGNDHQDDFDEHEEHFQTEDPELQQTFEAVDVRKQQSRGFTFEPLHIAGETNENPAVSASKKASGWTI